MAKKRSDDFTFSNKELYNLAKKGQENKRFKQAQTAEKIRQEQNHRTATANKAVDEYQKNGRISSKTASSLSKYRNSNYSTGDAFSDTANQYSAYNVLSKSGYKNYRENIKLTGSVADKLLKDYNDKRDYEINYQHNRSNREREAYREKKLAEAEEDYENKKSENRFARREAIIHVTDKEAQKKYKQTKQALADIKKYRDDIKQQGYSELQADNLKTLHNDKELSKMIDIAARRKITKGIKTIDQTQAQNTTLADDTNEYVTWKNYKKKLLNDGYTEKEIDNLVNARLAEINGEAYEGAAEFGKHAPVLAETFKIATSIPDEIANIGYSFDAAKGNTVVNPYATARAGIKSGIENYAEESGVDWHKLLKVKDNDFLTINKNNELVLLGKNQGNINRLIYDAVDQGVESVVNSLVFGGGITGGIMAKGSSEKIRQAVINTAFGSGIMGDQLAESFYNGEEASSAYKSALKVAAENWLTEMIGSPLEWAGVSPKSAIGKIAMSSLGEGYEEIANNAIDRALDYAVNGKASEMSQQFQEYIKQGKSKSEATMLVIRNMMSDDLTAAMSAGLSAFGMSGSSAISESVENKSAKKITGTQINANYNRKTLISEAKNIDNAEIKELVAKAENAKTEKARSKTLGDLATAVQQHLSDSHNENLHKIVYDSVKEKTSSEETAKQVADSIVNGSKAKSTTAKQYVYEINNDQTYFAKTLNDRLDAENYGHAVKQQYLNDMSKHHSKSFQEYTKDKATPQELYDSVTELRNSIQALDKAEAEEYHKGVIEKVEKYNANTLVAETSQTEIATENSDKLSKETKTVLSKGKAVQYSDIKGISNVDNGVVILNTNENEKVALQNVDFGGNKKAEQVFKLSAVFGDDAGIFMSNYFANHNNANPIDYFDKAKLAYESGLTRTEYEKVFGDGTFGLTEDETKALYNAGISQSVKATADIEKAKENGSGVHITEGTTLTRDQKRQVEVLKELTKGTSAKVVIAQSAEKVGLKDSNGYFDGDTIVVFANETENALLAYAGHELTHYLQKNVSKDMYSDYHDFVIEHLKSKGEEHYNEVAERYAKAYGFDTDTQMNLVEEEMVADNALAVLSDEKAMQELAKDNRTLLQKIGAFFRNLANKLKAIKEKLSKSSIVYSEVNHDIEFLEQSAEKIKTMLDSVKENTSKQNNAVKYSKNTDFPNQVDEWYKNGHNNNETFIIGDTGEVLQGLGAVDNQIYFYGSKINSILKKHSDTVSLDIIKKVPEIIDNPALVLASHSRSQENNSRLLMFGMVKDINGKPVMAVLDLQPMEKGLLISDMQKLTSAYSLTGEKIAINDYLNKSNVLYVTENKKIATKLVRQIGFHQNDVPIAFQQSGYIGNISYSGRSVNIQGVPFSEIFKSDDNVNKKFSKNTVLDMKYKLGTEREKEKIIQNLAMKWGAYSLDGKTPLKLYHGTKAFGFTEFDLDKMDDKRSIFLTDDITTAQTYSETYDVRKISEKNQIDLNKLSSEELINQIKEIKRYKNGEYYVKADFISMVNNEVELLKNELTREIENSNKHISILDARRVLRDTLEYCQKEGYEKTVDTDFLGFIKYLDDDKYKVARDVVLASEAQKFADNDVVNRSESIVFSRDKVISIVEEYAGKGNYALYAKLNNPFVIDTMGSDWRAIRYYEDISDEKKKLYPNGLWHVGDTREVAEYAYNQGYDGVVFKNIIDNGGNGEQSDGANNVVVVFDNKMVKSADTVTYDNDGNIIPPSERFTDKSDIRYSKDTNIDDFDVKRYNEVRISDKSEYATVMSAIKMSDLNDTPHFEIRKINTYGKSYLYYYDVDDNPHIVSKKTNENYRRVYNEINDTSDELLESIENDESRYRNSKRSYELSDRRRTATSNDKLVNREIQTENPDNGTGYTENDGDVDLRGEDNRYSRNTRLNYDENFDDVNEAFEQALKVLQNIKGIDVSSKVVEEVGKAQKNIDKELDGYHAQKMRNSNSVNKVARNLKEEYASNMPTGKLTNMLVDLYDYMANSDSTDMAYINSQAKVIANELINSSTSIVESDYKDIRKRITGKSYSLTPEVKKSLTEANGSWREARQSFSSQLRINPKSDMSIERLYTDLSIDYPDLFDSSIVDEQEMLYAISDFVENNADTVVYNYQDELEQQGNIRGQFSLSEFENVIAGDIYDSFFDIEQVQSAVDKLDNKYKAQIASMREEMNDQKSLIRQQYRENYENKLAEYKNHAKDVQARKKERTDITVLKNRIRRLRMQIDRKLLKPSGNNYVPRDLVQSMAKVCDMLVEADMSSHKSETTLSALYELQSKYNSLKNDTDYDYRSEYNAELQAEIDILTETLAGKQLKELSKSEMQDVYDIVKAISKTLQTAKELIDSDLKITAHQSAVKLMKQMLDTAGKGKTQFGKLDYTMMNPMRYVNLISEGNKDGVLNILFDELNRGARKRDFLTMKWKKPFETLVSSNKEYRRFREKLVETPFVDTNGEKVKLTESQIVQLIMTAKRKQGLQHLAGGGFVALDTKRLFDGKSGAKTNGSIVEQLAGNVNVQIADLTNELSPYAKEWLKSAESLFNGEVTQEVNSTSFALKGYKIANEEYYIPLITDKDYTANELEGVTVDRSIANAGFTKAINAYANNRLVISGIDQLVNQHIGTVADYVSLAIPIRNFNKVWIGQTSAYYDKDFIDDLNRKRLSVRETIKKKWGDEAVRLIENAITDLQSRPKSRYSASGELYNKVLNKTISATFLGNISIVLKQTASYPTAVAFLSSKSLMKGSKAFGYLAGTEKLQTLFDEIDSHTGALYTRRVGMQTEELATIMHSFKGFNAKWLNSKFGALHPAKWIQAMDVQTATALWLASKYEIEATNKYDKNSTEYWQAVTDLYDMVIENTQAEYDVLHRTEMEKSQNVIDKTVSLFQNQTFQQAGILYDAIREVSWAKRQLKLNDSEANQNRYDAAVKNRTKAVWSVASAGIVFSLSTWLVTFLLFHKTKKYRDDEGEITLNSTLKGIGEDTVEVILSNIFPIVGSLAFDIGSRIAAGLESGSWYDYDYIENMGLSAINDILKASVDFVATTGNAIKGEKELKDVAESSKDLITQIAQMCGVPANNMLNFYNSAVAYYKELVVKESDLWEYNSQPASSKDLLASYVEYQSTGDTEKSSKYKEKWQEANPDKTDKEFNSSVASYLAENESDIAKAVQYRNALDTTNYEKMLNRVIAKGYSKDIVTSAANSVANKVESVAEALHDGETDTYNDGFSDLVSRGYDEATLKKYIESIQSTFDGEDNAQDKIKSYYTTDELYRVWKAKGENSDEYKAIYSNLLQTKKANGTDEEKAKQSIENSIVKNYFDGNKDFQLAQQAYDQGDMKSYQTYVTKVIAENKLTKESIVKKARGYEGYKSTLWTATDYAKAIDQNDKEQANKIFKELAKANGDVKNETQYVRSSTTTYFRKKYLAATTAKEKSDIVAKLNKTGFYTQSDIRNLCNKWEKTSEEE